MEGFSDTEVESSREDEDELQDQQEKILKDFSFVSGETQ